MKSTLLLLATLFIFGSNIYSKAQVEKIINVTINVDSSLESNVLNLLDLANSNLQKLEISLVIVEASSENNVNLELTASKNERINGTNIYVNAITPRYSEISPILYPQFDEAAEIPIIWTEQDRIEAAANFITAISLYSINACEQAEPYFETAQKLQVIHTVLNLSYLDFYRGNCALGSGEIEKAIEYYNGALFWADSMPAFSTPTVNLTWLLLKYPAAAISSQNNSSNPYDLFDPNRALMKIRCQDNCPYEKLIDLYSRRAQLYVLAERYGEAIGDMNSAIELPLDDTPDLYILRGQMYLARYEWDSALADYNTAIELDPDYADAYYERGVLYYSILQTGVELRTDALADFQRYLELAPDGEKADDTARYVEQIETELEALNG